MIKVENLSYSFPQKDLYDNVSFTLDYGQHCAFIGASGSGKSTLIDIIMDPEKYLFDGKLEMYENYKIGYVSQFSQLNRSKELTVFDYICEEYLRLQGEIDSICAKMAEPSDDIEILLERYQEALDAFDAIDGDNFERNVLKKLNLADLGKHKDKMISELSGGEFKLIQIIREMLHNPDLMIMDEPDVFLDFENLNSLKNLINAHKKTIIVITHNRYLLNHCFNKILHLEGRQIQEFDGRFVDYNFSLLETKIELQEIYVAESEEIERNEVIIERLREIATYNAEASRGRALKARVKIQERLKERRIKAPFVDIKEPQINLITDNEIEETVALTIEDLDIAFEETLLENVNLEIKSNDKVAIIGPNGVGKTTLLKAIFKNKNENIKVNEDIKMSYLSQIQDEILSESNTILDEFYEVGFVRPREIRSYISRYGFDADAMDTKISSLSGGERNILQLAKISANKANMLLLDEPTSHLDMYSQIALEKAVKNYNGAVLMISHDYQFIVNCMDYVLIIEDKNVRRMNMRKFRKMIYSTHFDKDYLQLDQKKKEMEEKIAKALSNFDFELAKVLTKELEELIKLIK